MSRAVGFFAVDFDADETTDLGTSERKRSQLRSAEAVTAELQRPQWLPREWLAAELSVSYPRPAKARRRRPAWGALLTFGARVGLALPFLLGGMQKFVDPSAALSGPPASADFFFAMQGTFVFNELAAVQVLVAVMLLADVWVPLALAALAPISLTILPYEILYFGWPKPLLGAFVLLAQAYLIWVHRDAFRPLLSLRHAPPV